MPEKSKARKKSTKSASSRPASPRAKVSKSKPPKEKQAYFVVAPQLAVVVTRDKPAAAAAQFETLDEARRCAIDALVDAIEAAEAQLIALKRAGKLEEA